MHHPSTCSMCSRTRMQFAGIFTCTTCDRSKCLECDHPAQAHRAQCNQCGKTLPAFLPPKRNPR